MPTRTFSSFESFFAANLHSDLRGMVLGRRRENWVMTQVLNKTLSVQWGRAGSSVVVEGGAKPGGISIFLPTESPIGVSGNGHRLAESALVINQTGDEFCIANDSSRPWFSVYIPYETLAGASGDATTPVPLMHGFAQVPLPRIQRFRAVIRQFGEAVQRAATDFNSAAAQRAAEQKLVPEIRSLLDVQARSNPRLVGTEFRGDRSFAGLWILSSIMRASICLSNNSPPRLEFLTERFVLRFNNTSAWHRYDI